LEKAHALLAQVPDTADIILIGDSLAANLPNDIAQRQFRSDHVWNLAVGGSTTQNTLWQLARLEADGLKPRAAIVLVGTNNLTREDMPACAIAAGIKAVVVATHRQWPGTKVDVMGIPPRGRDFGFRDKDRKAVNAEIQAWARDQPYVHYFEVDAATMTCGQYERPVHVAAAGAEQTVPRCQNYADDFGHFKRAGYEVVLKALMGE
jgi:lysophospholipase L1-like esterase